MHRQRGAWLVACRTILGGAAIWVLFGVPVAAAISGVVLLAFVVLAVPEIAVTAATLGALQGLCLFVSIQCPPSRVSTSTATTRRSLRWFGAISGAMLGLLGFPPVYSHVSIVAKPQAIAIFLAAAIFGGAVAGLVSYWKLPTEPMNRLTLARSFAVCCVIVVATGGFEFAIYWNDMWDRLPVAALSHNAVTQLSAGSAKGTAWSGCYDYHGTVSQGSGMVGGEAGLLIIKQKDGFLEISIPGREDYRGGVDKNGRFDAGTESRYIGGTLRTLWVGKFGNDSFAFAKRVTLLRSNAVINSTRLTGTAQRRSCLVE